VGENGVTVHDRPVKYPSLYLIEEKERPRARIYCWWAKAEARRYADLSGLEIKRVAIVAGDAFSTEAMVMGEWKFSHPYLNKDEFEFKLSGVREWIEFGFYWKAG
jgi:hypothetical protein